MYYSNKKNTRKTKVLKVKIENKNEDAKRIEDAMIKENAKSIAQVAI